jgi:chemotaxis protein methyltransferase CheR
MSTSQQKLKIESKLSEAAFERIAALAQSEAGIVLSKSKESMIKSRLTRRLRVLKIESFDAYLDFLTNDTTQGEMSHFISALTTNVSHFFREEHHFEALKRDILPLLDKKLKSGQRVRIWSAGCSNGQEPYSIAMSLLEFDPEIHRQDIKILATDIDPEVLRHAIDGRYSGTMTSGLEESHIKKYFSATIEGNDETLTVTNDVKNLVSFRQLNLHSEWPMHGMFDVIFCRNVVIYFDDETQDKLYRRFAASMTNDSWLLLGHSERLGDKVTGLFKSVGVTTYKPTKMQPQTSAQNQLESEQWR